MGRDFARLVDRPWRELRKRVTGSPDTPIHANKFSAISQHGDIEAVAQFFQNQPFARVGAIISTNTQLANEMGIVKTIKEVLQARINQIMQPTLCREVKIIFESSQRVDKQIQDAFQNFALYRGSKRIPSECYFMPKKSADPGLEVADFIMHAIGRQARQNLSERGKFLPDFKAVFHSIDPRLVSFMEVSSVSINN